MAAKRIARGLLLTAVAGIGLSFLSAILFRKTAGIQAIAILVVEICVVMILLGWWLRGRQAMEGLQPGSLRGILELPSLTWVLIGFLFVYGLLFLGPIFLNSSMQMMYLSGYIPNLTPIGNDLRVMMDLAKGWITAHQSPYTIQFYPPLTYLIFAPLLLIKDPLRLYRVFTLFTFLNYGLLTLLLPLKILDKKQVPLVMLLFVTGLFSYGFQFEVERGQYNVFTFLLCLFSIYLFHYQPKHRLIAYFLFSLSVQLKLYPAIFIVMLVDNWRDWRRIALRFAGIALFNLMFFFVLGYQIFVDFMRSVTAQVVNPAWIGPWNHSISSFISVAKMDGFGLIDFETLRLFRHNSGWVEGLLILGFMVCFASALLIAYLRKEGGLDPYLLLTCTIGAMILPISYDYTLCILAVPVLLFLSGMAKMDKPWYKLLSILLTLGISVAYFTTLVPYSYRPYILNNAFPLLFIMLIMVAILNVMRYKSGKDKLLPEEQPSTSSA